jgi:hypothetical protein
MIGAKRKNPRLIEISLRGDLTPAEQKARRPNIQHYYRITLTATLQSTTPKTAIATQDDLIDIRNQIDALIGEKEKEYE